MNASPATLHRSFDPCPSSPLISQATINASGNWSRVWLRARTDGCVFWVDLDPSGRSDPHGPVAGLLNKVEQDYATARDGNYTLGGIYVDSVANAQDLLNYDPSKLRTAHYPPIFDTEGRPVVLMLQNTLAFLNFLSTHLLRPRGGVLMGNGPYYPETQYRFAPVFAVSGGETFWYNSNNKQSPFKPTSHELMALHRVMAYQRPYMPLQDSDFLDWTYEVRLRFCCSCVPVLMFTFQHL